MNQTTLFYLSLLGLGLSLIMNLYLLVKLSKKVKAVQEFIEIVAADQLELRKQRLKEMVGFGISPLELIIQAIRTSNPGTDTNKTKETEKPEAGK